MKLLIAIVVLIALNAVARVAAIRAPYLSRFQRTLQLMLVWLIPVFGALVIGLFHLVERRGQKRAHTGGAASNDGGPVDLALAARQDGLID